MIKDKKILGLGVLGLILVLAGAYLVFGNKTSNVVQTPQASDEIKVLSISPEDIGLTLTAGADGKRVIMKVTKTADIESLDYELSYISKGDIPRGVINHLDVKTKGAPITQEIDLGTCSDVCHYDEEVSSIKLILKVTKTNGKVYQAEKTLEL